MSPPVFRIDVARLADVSSGDEVLLPAEVGRHAVAVLRVRTGEVVELTDALGMRVVAYVVEVRGREHCRVRVSSVHREPEPALRFTVAQALLKGDQAERAVDLLTQAGVDAVLPWQAERCVARWDGDRGARGALRWADALSAAALQSRRAHWPMLLPGTDLAGVVACVRSTVDAGGVALVLHETAAAGLDPQRLPSSGAIVIVVGPEGGLTDHEVEALARAGAAVVRLGSPILRASSAGALAMAACSVLTRWSHDRIDP